MEIILSQPASPQYDTLPRRAVIDTESEEPGTPPRSPAIGTGSDGSGISRFETLTEEEGLFPLETKIDGSFNSNFISMEEEYVLLQPDIGMDNNNETTTQQAAAREELARPTKKRQQQGMVAWSIRQNKQFDCGRSRVKSLLF